MYVDFDAITDGIFELHRSRYQRNADFEREHGHHELARLWEEEIGWFRDHWYKPRRKSQPRRRWFRRNAKEKA